MSELQSKSFRSFEYSAVSSRRSTTAVFDNEEGNDFHLAFKRSKIQYYLDLRALQTILFPMLRASKQRRKQGTDKISFRCKQKIWYVI
jgi:hypothetical protein